MLLNYGLVSMLKSFLAIFLIPTVLKPRDSFRCLENRPHVIGASFSMCTHISVSWLMVFHRNLPPDSSLLLLAMAKLNVICIKLLGKTHQEEWETCYSKNLNKPPNPSPNSSKVCISTEVKIAHPECNIQSACFCNFVPGMYSLRWCFIGGFFPSGI